MSFAINANFEEILEPFGKESANFFLAAALYHAHKLSFATATSLAGLGFDDFAARLREHFGTGYLMEPDVIAEDIAIAKELTNR